MKVELKIFRFNPETDKKSRFDTYKVDAEPTDRVLDSLMHVYRNEDGSLAFRKSCAHGVCGSDAMRINGKERLACKTLIQDVADAEGDTILIEPLRHMTVQKDLMVDQSEFLERFKKVSPFLIPLEEAPEKGEYIQSQIQRDAIDDATKCINCGACYSACPILETNPDFLGPAALVHASRFIYDSRDKGLDTRLEILDQPNGVWACDSHFECTRVCPRGIKITKLINMTKREIKKRKGE
ncbi:MULTISPECIES: succinate dehydrogenase/fumarate reductase iron-sulfur subunit [unclassified Oceanispirochaeta]|uniref:succinate dehydrogenase/fumarate reductase iron-sulfur subunit n=1 Tax=unclassified Oceanispirochaeta TaxID=2635722 RepID=UPI000E0937B4|nr:MULTISPECIES: succinate dehydrogenase iron-sulfur subunit [unclassified Oceanispirochaeta]MBF9017487.1 succinate dehydrogenase iron-sulfur subunit [Oceanispirochaeta sp. M2]NPD74059.1 succinate dehydrogenase iron-sulfur subunit [Oceanispirochaeta sp. M1]RDG30101.1 succinate dehydrogenase iron-sulfur subunit [Oceanispirochaeta sp. M1]